MLVFGNIALCCHTGNYSAEEKYHIFMRHRYNSCVEILLDLLSHDVYNIKVSLFFFFYFVLRILLFDVL